MDQKRNFRVVNPQDGDQDVSFHFGRDVIQRWQPAGMVKEQYKDVLHLTHRSSLRALEMNPGGPEIQKILLLAGHYEAEPWMIFHPAFGPDPESAKGFIYMRDSTTQFLGAGAVGVQGHGNKVRGQVVGDGACQDRVRSLEEIIRAKDAQIELLQKMIAILQKD